MNPTDANLTAYMRYQRMVMNKSEALRRALAAPGVDRARSRLRPEAGGPPTRWRSGSSTNSSATGRRRPSRAWPRPWLIFVFRGDCPHCHRFAPILKRFEQEFGFTVLAISMDGRAIPSTETPGRQRHGRA